MSLKAFVPRKTLFATESWNGKGKMPFNTEKAVDAGLASLRRQHPEIDDFKLESIVLRRVACDEGLTDKWTFDMMFYGVKHVRNDTSCIGFMVWLLSDGSVVEPKAEKKQ